MIELYVGSLAFGGILIGVSLALGGHGGDAGHDADTDHGPDGDADHGPEADHAGHDGDGGHALASTHGGPPAASAPTWLPFLSMRFWTFFAASFGLTGLLLTLLGVPTLLTALIALPNGAAIGTGAAWFFKRLKGGQVTADVGLERFVGSEAKVLLPIRPGDTGKIMIATMAGRFEMPARSRDAGTLEPGARVLVAHVDNGIADVTSLPGAAGLRRQGASEPTT
jgi:hypothetical protein